MNELGRLLQLSALCMLPVVICLELAGALGKDGLSDMLKFLLFGIVLFYTGHYMQSNSKK